MKKFSTLLLLSSILFIHPALSNANEEETVTPAVSTSATLLAPQMNVPGTALSAPTTNDTISLSEFTPDTQNDSTIKTLIQSKSPLVAVRVETIIGKAANWKTQEVDSEALGVLRIDYSGKTLNPNNNFFMIDVRNPTELDLVLQDNGALLDKNTKLRVIFFHLDGSRTYSHVVNAG